MTAPAKHTPGPWHVGTRFVEGENDVLAADGFTVAEPCSVQIRKARNGRLVRRDISVEEAVANSNLIAAAPEAVEALERIVFAFAGREPTGVLRAEAKAAVAAALAAIAKARGRT